MTLREGQRKMGRVCESGVVCECVKGGIPCDMMG